ncbi:hypothetical protein MACK_003163 [Theileria orientalis]|uniref:Uncharacterized protein n=1 Tax=Theileria orientalis TaxID=68886 RepID=A0A976SI73_THEOR|nr:hypothetical protein MACK_003163 [Theileria orientalis]
MFNYFYKFGKLYIYLIVILNKCTISYRKPNIGTETLKTRLYSHDYSNSERNILDSRNYSETNSDFRQVGVKVDDGKRPLYNKHPRFCCGNYEIFDVDIVNEKDWEREDSGKRLVSYMDLLTKCKLRIEEFGKYTITDRKEWKDEDLEERKVKELEKEETSNKLANNFTDRSLSKLKEMFGKNDSDNDRGFMEQLKQEPIKTYKVEDLIENCEVGNMSREDLTKFMEKVVLGEVKSTLKQSIEAVDWEYFPSTKTVRICMFLKEMSKNLYLTFKLNPGTKPLVIEKGVLKMDWKREKTSDIDNSLAFSSRARVKVRSIEEDPMKQMVKRDPLNHKKKIISIRGNSRSRFNRIFSLLQGLSSNLRNNVPSKNVLKASEVKVEFDTESPLEFKIISVRVNSQYKFLIPLMTYMDLTDGETYLCNASVPIEAKPSRVWPLRNGTYAEYNMRFVPECYKNAAFFSNLDMELRQEDILKILSSHLEFKKLFEKDVSHRDPETDGRLEQGETMDEKGNNKGKEEDYDVYYVNGTNKMIYKPCEGAILINLLI